MKNTTPSQRSIMFPVIKIGRHAKETAIINGISINNACSGTINGLGETQDDTPKTQKTLKMFEPTTLPTAISVSFFQTCDDDSE